MLRVYIGDTAPLTDSDLFQRCYGLLPTSRCRKIDKIQVEAGKRLSLGAGLLLRKICLDCNIGSADENVIFGENGKPYFASYPEIYFNLAHSGERVMAAVADKEIGCDVEQIKRADMQVARRFFSSDEYKIISQETASAKQNELFYRFWTAKESFIKCNGRGFALPFGSFAVELDSGVLYFEAEKYCTFEYDIKDGYRYAVCLKGDLPKAELPKLIAVDFNRY